MASPDDRETGIRDIAYSLWEQEGRPRGGRRRATGPQPRRSGPRDPTLTAQRPADSRRLRAPRTSRPSLPCRMASRR